MAGIGVRLNRIFGKNTISSNLLGVSYSAGVTVTPMFVIIGNIMLMSKVLEFDKVGYASRELFSCTVLYIFIFSLLTSSPFNAVLSRYMSDIIYKEQFEDILPCFYVGLVMNVALSALFGIPFCIWEFMVGHIGILYVFTGFCGYMALALVFYSMLYLSICKDYTKISLFFLLGMALAFALSLVFAWGFHMKVPSAMLLALVIGFAFIACAELAVVKYYFKHNSGRYRPVLGYFKKYFSLVLTNFFYTLGLYVHNFVYWFTGLRMTVADTFICAQPYDMATCIAMFTNISATVILIARLEMNFHEKYKQYSEAVIGGRASDIRNAQKRMFHQLAVELMNLVRIQFIITVVVFLLFVVLLPQFGFAGLVMRIYPCLAVGYFILFLMYSEIIFLYYFNDNNGAMLTAASFVAATALASVFASGLAEKWYGVGVVIGAFVGWTVAYMRLRWVEKHMEVHVFCRGMLIKMVIGIPDPPKVYDAYAKLKESKEEAEHG